MAIKRLHNSDPFEIISRINQLIEANKKLEERVKTLEVEMKLVQSLKKEPAPEDISDSPKRVMIDYYS